MMRNRGETCEMFGKSALHLDELPENFLVSGLSTKAKTSSIFLFPWKYFIAELKQSSLNSIFETNFARINLEFINWHWFTVPVNGAINRRFPDSNIQADVVNRGPIFLACHPKCLKRWKFIDSIFSVFSTMLRQNSFKSVSQKLAFAIASNKLPVAKTSFFKANCVTNSSP